MDGYLARKEEEAHQRMLKNFTFGDEISAETETEDGSVHPPRSSGGTFHTANESNEHTKLPPLASSSSSISSGAQPSPIDFYYQTRESSVSTAPTDISLSSFPSPPSEKHKPTYLTIPTPAARSPTPKSPSPSSQRIRHDSWTDPLPQNKSPVPVLWAVEDNCKYSASYRNVVVQFSSILWEARFDRPQFGLFRAGDNPMDFDRNPLVLGIILAAKDIEKWIKVDPDIRRLAAIYWKKMGPPPVRYWVRRDESREEMEGRMAVENFMRGGNVVKKRDRASLAVPQPGRPWYA